MGIPPDGVDADWYRADAARWWAEADRLAGLRMAERANGAVRRSLLRAEMAACQMARASEVMADRLAEGGQ